MSSTRKRTTTEPITVPYRHGILHGQDLGYDNKLVAAKVWAALFSIREWALAAQHNRLEAPPPTPQPSIQELLAQSNRIKHERELISAWRPRPIEELEALPKAGSPQEYDLNSPEAAVVRFLLLWKQKNYGEMATHLLPCFRERLSKAAGSMRSEFGDKSLEAFEISEIRDEAPAISEIRVRVWFEQAGVTLCRVLHCRTICHNDCDDLSWRGIPNTSWYYWPALEEP